LNEALLERYLKNAGELRFKPVVAFLPGTGDNDEDRERRGFLRTWTARRRVAYLDLTEPIHGAGIDKVFIAGNWHWNPAGHRLAAEQLAAVIATVQDVEK
jgi:hypothetical protein